LAVLLVWLALVRGIRPLNELEQRIRARKPDDLSPIEESFIPQEVAPLVSSINDLLSRLKTSLSTQKRFLADAAHQLKTPLAGLRMQADLAQRESDPKEIRNSLQHIARSSVRATHTVNQLLALARAETTGRNLPIAGIDLAQLVTEVVQDSVPRALEHGVDLGYEGPSHIPKDRHLEGNTTLLQEMVRNLVDNAINYSGQQGVVTVRVFFDPYSGVQILQVEDNGPGIADSIKDRIFYPLVSGRDGGSGLGLTLALQVTTMRWSGISSVYSAIASISRGAGLVGNYFAIVGIVLVSRIPWVERGVGHDRLVTLHRKLGPWSLHLIGARALGLTFFCKLPSRVDSFHGLCNSFWGYKRNWSSYIETSAREISTRNNPRGFIKS
jgi:signal transduction histidine kinase